MASTLVARSHRTRVTEIGGRLAGVQQALIEAVVALDESGEWAADGAVTCAHWIADHLDVEVCTAREWLRIGKLLTKLPEIAGRFAERSLSYSKVRALTRVATRENEVELVEIAQRTPASRLAHALAGWLRRSSGRSSTMPNAVPSTPPRDDATRRKGNAESFTNNTEDVASTAEAPISSNTTTNPPTRPPSTPPRTNSNPAARPATTDDTAPSMGGP